MSNVSGTPQPHPVGPAINPERRPAGSGPSEPRGLSLPGGPGELVGLTGGCGLRDLRNAGLGDLAGLRQRLRLVRAELRRLRNRLVMTADLAWRLAGITLTALLSCLLESAVTRAVAQAAVIAALTIALSQDRGNADIGPQVRRTESGSDCPPRGRDHYRDHYSGACSTACAPALPQEAVHVIPGQASRAGPQDLPGAVIVCRVVPTPAQVLVMVTVLGRADHS